MRGLGLRWLTWVDYLVWVRVEVAVVVEVQARETGVDWLEFDLGAHLRGEFVLPVDFFAHGKASKVFFAF